MSTVRSLAFNGTIEGTESNDRTGDTTTQMKMSGQGSQSPESMSMQMDGTVSTQGTTIPISIAMIMIDQKTYAQNTKKQGPWYILNAAQSASFGSTNLNTSHSSTIAAATASDVTDHGLETVNGKKLRHLTIVVTNDNKALKEAFLKESDEFKNLRQVQLDSIKLQNGAKDYWIDESSMYTYQQKEQYTIQYSVDDEGTVTVDTPNITKKQSMTMVFSNFDKPVDIKAPADAQPLDSIGTLII